jgi:2',3'-cyclic-nucleotide 2'-phosphodiesterase (5'-nucleotidase family)
VGATGDRPGADGRVKRAAAALIWAAALAAPAPAGAHPPSQQLTLSIVGTSDLHGRLEALPAFGGYLANLRRARARDGGAVLLLDAGDLFQGTLASNLTEGAPVVKAYALLGYTAVAVGNHEFDFGPVGPSPTPRSPGDDPRGALKARAAEAPFPFLAGNLIDGVTGAPPVPPWRNVRPTALITVGGMKVGLVGVTTAATARTTLAVNFAGLATRPLAPAIAAAARALRRQGATIVVVAAHAGGECKGFDDPAALGACAGDAEIFQVARALPAGAVDAIVAGHTHQGVAHVVAGIPIVQSFANGRAFGRIDATIERATGRVVATHVFPPQGICTSEQSPEVGPDPRPDRCAGASYEGAPVVPDPAVAAAIGPALAAAETRRQQPLGVYATAPIRRAHKAESPLGNLIADLMRAARPAADVALTNGGGLRADLPAGPLRYGALFEAQPFDNTFAILPLSGAELAAVVARNLGRDGGIVSLSGVRARARCAAGALSVTLTRTDGRPIGPDERLTLVTSNFLATGGDGLFPAPIAARAAIEDGSSIREALADQLGRRKTPVRPDDPALYDPTQPRLDYPGPRPLRCVAP